VNEAFGMALLEAQAAGLPVVSCALRGVPDVVLDGRTGLLAPAIDETQLAVRMRELLTDEKKRTAMGREAARFVREERTAQVAARQFRKLP
jgi:glycosyltransferase involved in cell wall biosynthesis